jgi:hypothetical protein
MSPQAPAIVKEGVDGEQPLETVWRQVAEDMLIYTYVPEADRIGHEQALQLALERDQIAAGLPVPIP